MYYYRGALFFSASDVLTEQEKKKYICKQKYDSTLMTNLYYQITDTTTLENLKSNK